MLDRVDFFHGSYQNIDQFFASFASIIEMMVESVGPISYVVTAADYHMDVLYDMRTRGCNQSF